MGVKRMGSDTELIGVQEALNFVAQSSSVSSTLGAVAVPSVRDRSMSLQPAASAIKFFTKPISWEENAVANQHIFHEVDTREACYFTDSIHCQQAKLFHQTKRQKIRCSACKVVVHVTCQEKLEVDSIHCKDTFREIRQKLRDTVVVHHFLNRRKPVGKSKCSKCDKGFGNWKFMTGREVVAVSCSWCGDSYHVACFSPTLNQEPCHMGPLRRLIIQPSWIIRVPNVDRAASQGDESPKPFSVSRRKTRKSRRRKVEQRPSKYSKVKAFSKQHKPLLV
ncbi:Diacylglycerol kinase iota, partial [Geodia barretti]